MMKYISTRAQSPAVGFLEAVDQGLAPDGGLYVPERFPAIDTAKFDPASSVPVFAAELLKPFLAGSPLVDELNAICRDAFQFPIPLRSLKDDSAVLELFHGPTAAFKDVGARFLAACVSRMRAAGDEGGGANKRRTVIVATSGDTGGAVAGAFFDKPGLETFVLFPKGKISARQEKQIACWGGRVHALAVRGTFDDCQRVVKEALNDSDWRSSRSFISANSISIGRLLPQMIYYARSSQEYLRATGRPAGVIVPTGNLGNAVAALWAKRLGFPITTVVLATNANRAISDFLQTGAWRPLPTVATLANAMDVGNPSNVERLRHLYPDSQRAELLAVVKAVPVSDADISAAIQRGPKEWGEVWCPHTATAVVARERIGGRDWIMVSTAHPAKFETIVEPLIGRKLDVPPALAALLDRPAHSTEIEPTLMALKRFAAGLPE
jgi:threonine synthase